MKISSEQLIKDAIFTLQSIDRLEQNDSVFVSKS